MSLVQRLRGTCESAAACGQAVELTFTIVSSQYETLHETKVVEAELTQLKLALSDQNLELLPDYEQRVDVLKQLEFIDENSTVLLKGRVACEVCFTTESF